MASVWPPTLPQLPLEESYQERPGEQTLRTEMTSGPSKTRRRFTADIRKFQMTFLMLNTDITTLDSFYDATLNGGADAFDFVDVRTGNVISLKFVSPPIYTIVNGPHWVARCSFEKLP